MARTPQQVFENHVEVLGTGDLDKIAADYSDDAIHILFPNGTVRRGKAGVKEAFAELLGALSAAGEIKALEVPVRIYEDDILYIEWWADLGDMRGDGWDTIVFRDGEIRVQTLKYEITKAG